ncbi:GTP cyclohydrolase II [Candidatus Micrarchaeota archaeon]|nr:GTP cyclohydrolase II [Candidatus Micrarchaeota archaeon]
MEHIDEAAFPTKFGTFTVHAFVDEGREHLALVRCTNEKCENVPVRIHSKCLTGDTFSSLRCDCRNQLEAALEYLGKEEDGIFIYLDQEGRGIGLANKIKAYALQDGGLDTVEANLELGFCDDLRDYAAAAEILKYFKIESVTLLTNNPDKIKELEEHGIKVAERVPLISDPNEHNEKYLKTKKEKMNHQL